MGAIPVAGLGFDAAKAARLAKEGVSAIKLVAHSSLPVNVKNAYKFFQDTNWSRPIAQDGARAGAEYKNTTKLLPAQPQGYYKEFDVNPKGVGRDAERFIRGEGGEVYFTLDHYTTFVRIQ